MIAVGHAVQAVTRRAGKTQILCQRLAIYRIRRTGKRATTKRATVHTFVCIGQTAVIAFKHFYVCHAPMCKSNRLRTLQMGVTRHHSILRIFRSLHQMTLQIADGILQFNYALFAPQFDIKGYLVVTATASM